MTSILGLEATTPAPPWEVAAAYAAQAARALTNDPARPLQTLPLTGIRAAAKGSRFSSLERSVLAKSGIAVQDVRANGTMQISREQTTYTLDAYGVGDTAYGVVTTLATLARIIRNQRQIVTSKFGRHKLANNGTAFGPGQAIVTPNIVKAELIAQYAADQELGLVENLEAFKANLIVERDPSNNDRLNVLYPPDLINQLRIFAVLAQFRLQYPASADAVSA